MMKRFILYTKKFFLLTCFLVAFFVMIPGVFVFAKQEDSSHAMTPRAVVRLVNEERISQGLSPLQESETLRAVAEKKIAHMAQERYFGHTSPQGEDPWKWFERSGYDFSYAGENLATHFTTARAQHLAWMNSPKHKKNILDKRFTQTGVAVKSHVVDGEEQFVTVQVFATPQTVAITSPNYTPSTFEVPEELIHRGNDNIKNVLSHENHYTTYQAAGLLSPGDMNIQNTDITQKSYIPWIIIFITIVAIIIAEYYIFLRKSSRVD